MSAMRLPDQIVELAERQLGVVARRQFPADIPRYTVDNLVRRGVLDRLERGVYAVRGGAVHRHREAIAAALRVGPRATLSGPAALELAGVEGLVLGRRFVLLLRPPVRASGTRALLRRDRDPLREVASVGEVRVAPAVDALLDAIACFGRVLAPRALKLVHDQLRWADVLRAGDLHRRAVALGMIGQVADHELLELDATAATGDGERGLGRLLAGFDPPPEPQVWVTPHRCVDWYFRSVRLGVEYQGSVDHEGRRARARDGERERELRRAGIHLTYVTAGDLRDEGSLIAAIAGALAVRAHELRVSAPQLRGRSSASRPALGG